MTNLRCYTDREWAKAVSVEWEKYDPKVNLHQLKFFRTRAIVSRPPRWMIGATELWNIKRQ